VDRRRTEVTTDKDPQAHRVMELIQRIKPILRADEFVAIMTADFNTFVLVPDEVRRRTEDGTTTPQDTLTGLLLAHNMHAIILKMHADAIGKDAGKHVQTAKTRVLGLDGKPYDPS
jgi:hypothetical protein